MSQEQLQIKSISEMFGGSVVIEPVKDEPRKEVDFSEPITGAYLTKLKSISKKEGTDKNENGYIIYKIALQCAEDLSGDKSSNRYMYFDTFISLREDAPTWGAKALLESLKTMGLLPDDLEGKTIVDVVDPLLFDKDDDNVNKDKDVYVRVWKGKPTDYHTKGEQKIKIVENIVVEEPAVVEETWSE